MKNYDDSLIRLSQTFTFAIEKRELTSEQASYFSETQLVSSIPTKIQFRRRHFAKQVFTNRRPLPNKVIFRLKLLNSPSKIVQ